MMKSHGQQVHLERKMTMQTNLAIHIKELRIGKLINQAKMKQLKAQVI